MCPKLVPAQKRLRPIHLVLPVLLTGVGLLIPSRWVSPTVAAAAEADRPAASTANTDTERPADWMPLFDGKSLDGWRITQFGGQGDVLAEEGCLVLGFGVALTGVTYEKKFPLTNYELQLEARRIDGTDFFCGLTFPVQDSHCSLIVGGWGGALVGLSSIDGLDASENETQQIMGFKRGQWYPIRVRVTNQEITAWIDGKKVIEQPLTGRKISTRPEVNLSKPLGIASWQTHAELRKIRFRRLSADPR